MKAIAIGVFPFGKPLKTALEKVGFQNATNKQIDKYKIQTIKTHKQIIKHTNTKQKQIQN